MNHTTITWSLCIRQKKSLEVPMIFQNFLKTLVQFFRSTKGQNGLLVFVLCYWTCSFQLLFVNEDGWWKQKVCSLFCLPNLLSRAMKSWNEFNKNTSQSLNLCWECWMGIWIMFLCPFIFLFIFFFIYSALLETRTAWIFYISQRV